MKKLVTLIIFALVFLVGCLTTEENSSLDTGLVSTEETVNKTKIVEPEATIPMHFKMYEDSHYDLTIGTYVPEKITGNIMMHLSSRNMMSISTGSSYMSDKTFYSFSSGTALTKDDKLNLLVFFDYNDNFKLEPYDEPFLSVKDLTRDQLSNGIELPMPKRKKSYYSEDDNIDMAIQMGFPISGKIASIDFPEGAPFAGGTGEISYFLSYNNKPMFFFKARTEIDETSAYNAEAFFT